MSSLKENGHKIAQTSPKLNFFRQILRDKTLKNSKQYGFLKFDFFLAILLPIVSEKDIYPVSNTMKNEQNSKNWA